MYNVFFDYAPLFEYENSNFKENSWIFISVTRLIISQEYIYIYTFQIRFTNLHASIYSTFVGTFIERL